MSVAEFLAVDDRDEHDRDELVPGVCIVTPPRRAGERKPNDELGLLLRQFCVANAEAAPFFETMYEQEIETSTGVRRAAWCGLRRPPVPDRAVPTIVVDFVSRFPPRPETG